MKPILTKLKIETLFDKLSTYDKMRLELYKEIAEYQNQCDHFFEDDLSAIIYKSTDLTNDFYVCEICKKEFKGNPHSK